MFHFIENNKFSYEGFDTQAMDSSSSQIRREFERTDFMCIEFIESVEEGNKEFGFDIDTCYAIADPSERLEVPVFALMRACFELVAEIQPTPNYLELAAIKLGIHSYGLECLCIDLR